MDTVSFDALTRAATRGVSRRQSVMTLGAAGLAALLAVPFAAEAKKGGKKKHKGNKQPQVRPAPQECPPLPVDLCPGEVQPCIDNLTAGCDGSAECLAAIPCCSHFETCDVGGFFTCFFAAAI